MDNIFSGFILAGAAVGSIMGLTGAGGGILSVPLLVMVMGMPLQQASPIALLAISAAAFLAAGIGLYRRQLRYRAAALMAAMGLVASPAGIWLARQIPAAPLQALFGCVLLWVAIKGLRGAKPQTQTPSDDAPPCRLDPTVGRLVWTNPCARALAGSGLLAGFMAGLLGVGGGFVLIPALRRYTDLNAAAIVSTSLGVLALVTGGSALMAAASGGVSLTQALPFIAGAVGGLGLGKWVEPHLPEHTVGIAFSVLTLFTGCLMITKALAA
jgi:uncharacterized membrane protein YfcA